MLKCSHACVVVMLKYGPHSYISIMWEVVDVRPCCRLHFRKRITTPSQFKNMSSRTNWKQKITAELLPQTHLYGETNNIRSLSSVTVPSIVEVTVDNQRSAPGSVALRRTGATSALVKTTLHKCRDTNIAKGEFGVANR